MTIALLAGVVILMALAVVDAFIANASYDPYENDKQL